MFKLKNSQLTVVVTALIDLGNRTSDIKMKWNFRKKLTPFLNANTILQEQVQSLIKSEGEEGKLDTSNKSYQELMDCESDIDCKKFTLDELEPYFPSVEHLVMLECVIKED